MASPPMRRVNITIKHNLPKFVNLGRQTIAAARATKTAKIPQTLKRQSSTLVVQHSRPSPVPQPQLQPQPQPQPQPQQLRRPTPQELRRPSVVAQPKRIQLKKTSANVAGIRKTLINAIDANVAQLRDVGKGRILIVVGNGPSISEAPLDKLKGVELIDIMSINKPDKRLWPTRWWSICDHTQYLRNPDNWNDTRTHVITATSVRVKDRTENRTIVRIKQGIGFSRDLMQGYHIGRSTVYANMQTAHYMNYDKVFIFGLDMCADPKTGKLHHYGTNPDVSPNIRKDRFKHEANSYQWAADNLTENERDRYVICSAWNPWPFANRFNRLDHKTAVDDILKLVEQIKARPKEG